MLKYLFHIIFHNLKSQYFHELDQKSLKVSINIIHIIYIREFIIKIRMNFRIVIEYFI